MFSITLELKQVAENDSPLLLLICLPNATDPNILLRANLCDNNVPVLQ